jgi:DNA-binding NtrC family response regulator
MDALEIPTINILYVDDEAHNLETFKANFRKYYNIFTAISAGDAKIVLKANEIHVLITDQKMPGTTGTQLLEDAVQLYPLQTRIMLTAYSDKNSIMDAFHKGLVFKYIDKPYNPEELKVLIDEAYEVYKLKRIKEKLYLEWLKINSDIEIASRNKT